MKCSIQGCCGEYEARQILHPVRSRGRVVVIDHVPAEVCSVCGDVLLSPDTVVSLEELLNHPHEPNGTVPLYEFPSVQTAST